MGNVLFLSTEGGIHRTLNTYSSLKCDFVLHGCSGQHYPPQGPDVHNVGIQTSKNLPNALLLCFPRRVFHWLQSEGFCSCKLCFYIFYFRYIFPYNAVSKVAARGGGS